MKDYRDNCKRCDEEIFESENLSRCLRCGRATEREVNGSEYYKNKQRSTNDGINEGELR